MASLTLFLIGVGTPKAGEDGSDAPGTARFHSPLDTGSNLVAGERPISALIDWPELGRPASAIAVEHATGVVVIRFDFTELSVNPLDGDVNAEIHRTAQQVMRDHGGAMLPELLWTHRLIVDDHGDGPLVVAAREAAATRIYELPGCHGTFEAGFGVTLLTGGTASDHDCVVSGISWAQIASAIADRAAHTSRQVLHAARKEPSALVSDLSDSARIELSEARVTIRDIRNDVQGLCRRVVQALVDEWEIEGVTAHAAVTLEAATEMLHLHLAGDARRADIRRNLVLTALSAVTIISLGVDLASFSVGDVVNPDEGPDKLPGAGITTVLAQLPVDVILGVSIGLAILAFVVFRNGARGRPDR